MCIYNGNFIAAKIIFFTESQKKLTKTPYTTRLATYIATIKKKETAIILYSSSNVKRKINYINVTYSPITRSAFFLFHMACYDWSSVNPMSVKASSAQLPRTVVSSRFADVRADFKLSRSSSVSFFIPSRTLFFVSTG